MKKRFNQKVTVLLAAAILVFNLSCGGEKKEDPILSIYPSVSSIVFTANGTTLTSTFTVVTNQKPWDIASDQKWLTVTKSDNTFTVSANPVFGLTAPDAAKLTITAGSAKPVEVGVTQRANSPTLKVTPAIGSLVFSADGKSATSGGNAISPEFTVETNLDGWEAKSDQNWLKVSKSGNTFSLSATPVTGVTEPEDAKLTVKAGDLTPFVIEVSQLANPAVLTVTPTVNAITFSADGTTATSGGNVITPVFTVTTNVGDWSAISNQNWLTVTSDKAKNTFTLTATANANGYSPDEAKLTVKAGTAQDVIIFVKQDANSNIPSNYKDIINPYASVNFTSTLTLKGQFHVHTSASDAAATYTINYMLGEYEKRKYDIVAITDHDHEAGSDYQTKYQTAGVDYKSEHKTINGRNILKIQGVEISNYPKTAQYPQYPEDSRLDDHFNHFFVEQEFWDAPRQKGMFDDMGAQIANSTGTVLYLNHPWRNKRVNPVEYFREFYSTYPADRLVGIEIGENTEKDFTPPSLHSKTSTQVWDELLTIFTPERNIYCSATDDSHGTPITATAFFGLRWTYILVPENTISNVKEALRNGHSFAMFNTTGNNAVEVHNRVFPSVQNIVINKDNMSITVEAKDYTKIEWVSCGKTVLSDQKTLSPDKLNLEKYVRFVLTGANGTLYSQPFLLVKKDID